MSTLIADKEELKRINEEHRIAASQDQTTIQQLQQEHEEKQKQIRNMSRQTEELQKKISVLEEKLSDNKVSDKKTSYKKKYMFPNGTGF